MFQTIIVDIYSSDSRAYKAQQKKHQPNQCSESHVQKGVPEEILGDVGFVGLSLDIHGHLLRFGIWTPPKKT